LEFRAKAGLPRFLVSSFVSGDNIGTGLVLHRLCGDEVDVVIQQDEELIVAIAG